MIRSVDLLNFQGHTESHIALSDGFNAITGVSDAGKSSIIRALNWIRLNRPSGDDIRNWNADESAPTESTITLSDRTVVLKHRENKKSHYEIHKGKKVVPFEAIKTDVPEEIEQALNMTDINIQSQHAQYLFLDDTAGEVARKLNELVGLDIIDTIYKNLNSRITDTKRNIASLDKEIEEKELQVENLSYLDDIEIRLKELETFVDKSARLHETRISTEASLITLEVIENKIIDLKQITKLKPEVEILLNLCHNYESKKDKHSRIAIATRNLEGIQTGITEEEEWLSVKPKFEALQSTIEQLKILSVCVKKTGEFIKTIESITSKMNAEEGTLETNKINYKSLLIKLKICPTCGQSITEKVIGRIF